MSGIRSTVTGPGRDGAPRSPTRIRLLGRFSVDCAGEVLTDAELGNRKARLLLKRLAVRHDHHVPMDAIIEALWGESPPAKAVENVATLVSRLRSALGPALVDGGRSGYRLVIPPGCTVDVDEAIRLVAEAESRLHAGQPALGAVAAEQALELLGVGTPLEEETAQGDWLDELHRDHERLVRRARHIGWRANTAIGEHRRALALADQAARDDPLDEDAHRTVIAAHHRLGEPGEALVAYERLRTVLVEELGADPAPETEALHLAVLRGEPIVETGGRGPAPDVSRVRLVGRDHELAALVAQWERAARGEPTCVLVVGEPGIGKTRLVETLAEDVATAGAATVISRCYESEESLFLQPLVETVRDLAATLPTELIRGAMASTPGSLARLVPDVAGLLERGPEEPAGPEMERRRMFEAVAGFLAAVGRRRPLLVVLDDVHHAGASTIELVHFALRWDRGAPLMFALTTQDDRADLVESRLGSRSVAVPLGPLTDDAVVALAREAGCPDIALDLARRTKGNTLFVVEALKAIADGSTPDGEIPASLRSAVTARVSRCGEGVEEFLRGAVVAGASFEVDHVVELLGSSAEDGLRHAEAARRAGLLTEVGSGYEFANDMIRRTLYESTPLPTRVARHRRLATLLGARPETAGAHAAAAGDWEVAVDHWLEAAARAMAVFANHEAEGLLDRAFDACTMLGDPHRAAGVQQLRGRARLAQARYDDAIADFSAVQTLARATGDADLEAASLEELAWCAYYARRIARADELAERALHHRRAGPGARVLTGRLQSARGDLADAIETLELVTHEVPEPVVSASASSYLGTALAHADRFGDAGPVLDEAVARCRIAGLLRPMFNAMFFSAMTRANRGDLEGALDATRAMASDAERYENAAYRPRAVNLMSWLWRELGEPERALDLAHEALAGCVLPDGFVEAEPAAHARLQLAESAFMLGDEAGAERWLEELTGDVIANVAFGWRVELHRLELATRIDASNAEALLSLATEFGSAKYRALALGHLGRKSDAAAVAATTGSDLLIASVAPVRQARQAAERVASGLDPEHRRNFLERGRWRR